MRCLKEVFGVGTRRDAVTEAGVLKPTDAGLLRAAAGVLRSSREALRLAFWAPGVFVGVITVARL